MDFAAWEPIYKQILEDFGFDRAGDEEAARFISRRLQRITLPVYPNSKP
jgi:uncharacterized Rossmann fold enzyme